MFILLKVLRDIAYSKMNPFIAYFKEPEIIVMTFFLSVRQHSGSSDLYDFHLKDLTHE